MDMDMETFPLESLASASTQQLSVLSSMTCPPCHKNDVIKEDKEDDDDKSVDDMIHTLNAMSPSF
jgi:hypothetical protein